MRQVEAQKLRWCDYLHVLGVISEECMPDDSSLEKARQVERQLQYPEYHLCQGRYGMCSKTSECESGIMCSQTFTNIKCCTSPFSDCPTVDELGYSCRKNHPTNWCLQDNDCAVGLGNGQGNKRLTQYRCCPTGCSYNVCVRKSTMNAIQMLHAAIDTKTLPPTDCPSPIALKYRCHLAAVGASTSTMCRRHSDCPQRGSYGHMDMNCCATPCGFGVCISNPKSTAFVIG
ncbi:hypothetical protein M3Y97_00120200 [Aphelenchoides bicaudatus]|nr:hypothetical protein M3Y97_00120200 [Aphelenchoides bicaudatus]